MTDTASIPTTDTDSIAVTPQAPEPVTAATAVVNYPSVIPIDERRTDIAFRVATAALLVAALANTGLLVHAVTTGGL